MKKRIQLGIITVLFIALCSFFLISIVQDYQEAGQQATQCEQDKGSSAIYEEPLYVNGKDSDSHSRSASDYFLELREAGGRRRRVGVSYDFWADVSQGDIVTGEIWQDKVRRVKDHGQFQPTATNPYSQIQVLRYALWKWGAIGLFIAGVLLYSNWYWYKNPHSLELEPNDANL